MLSYTIMTCVHDNSLELRRKYLPAHLARINELEQNDRLIFGITK